MEIEKLRIDRPDNKRKARYHAVLKFKRAELLYDIKNAAYVEGHLMSNDAGHARHMTIDIAEDGNIDRVNRLLNLHHAAVVEMLYPYTKHDVHVSEQGEPWTDDPVTPDEYRIDLLLPDGFSQSTVNLLEHWVHEYLVCRVLGDWLAITNPDKAQTWLARADDAEEAIHRATTHRQGVLQRKLRPF